MVEEPLYFNDIPPTSMALNLKNPLAEQLAQQLAAETGESLTQAVIVALRERLERRGRQRDVAQRMAEVAELQSFLKAQPVRDARSPEEILGYDDAGLPR
jgi:antitoxin VapB